MAKQEIPKKGDPDYWEYMSKIGVKAIKASKAGRPKKIESPERLWELACKYFEEVDDRPFQKQDFIRGGESAGTKVHLDNIRPYSWAGFETFLIKYEVIHGLDHYRQNTGGAYEEYRGVIARIDKTMFDQKLEGASVGAFNASIIARDLQLAEITKTEVNAKVKNEVDYTQLSDEALAELAKQSELNATESKSK